MGDPNQQQDAGGGIFSSSSDEPEISQEGKRMSTVSQASTLVDLARNPVAELDERFFHVVPDENRRRVNTTMAVNPPGSEVNLATPYDGARDFRDLRISLNLPTGPLPEINSNLDSLIIGPISPIELMETNNTNGSELIRIVELTDSWRQTLDRGEIPKLKERNVMDAFLEECLNLPDPGLPFTVIISSRLDKLLEVFVEKAKFAQSSENPLKDLGKKAAQLERKWQRCYKGRLFAINDERKMVLTSSDGRLQDIYLNPFPKGNSPEWLMRHPENQKICEFEAGHWWLNCACAHRDGIVNNISGAFTENALGTPTLYLSRGTEFALSQPGITRYIHQGPIREMQLPLLSLLDRKIKVLRGYRLKSLIAPKAGLRYDGFYFVKTYSHKRLNQETELFRLEVTLERAPDQRSLTELSCIPLPSQMDDWELYMKVRDDDVRARCSSVEYAAWRREEFQKHKEREEWLHHQTFLESLTTSK